MDITNDPTSKSERQALLTLGQLVSTSFAPFLLPRLLELQKSLSQRTLIFLDTNHWVNLRHVVLASSKETLLYREILKTLEALHESGKALCPLTFTLHQELLKQTDPETRQATLTLMSHLSDGVCIRFDILKHQWRQHAYRTLLRQGAPEVVDCVFTKTPFLYGDRVAGLVAMCQRKCGISLEQAIEKLWSMSLGEVHSCITQIPVPAAVAESFAQACNSQERVRDTGPSEFQRTLRGFKRGQISEFKQELMSVGGEITSILGRKHHPSLLLEPFVLGNDPHIAPYLQIHAGAQAAILNTNRRFSPHDIHDLESAAMALPYCDAVCLDNYMANLFRNKPLDYARVYQTEILSQPPDILRYLRTLVT